MEKEILIKVEKKLKRNLYGIIVLGMIIFASLILFYITTIPIFHNQTHIEPFSKKDIFTTLLICVPLFIICYRRFKIVNKLWKQRNILKISSSGIYSYYGKKLIPWDNISEIFVYEKSIPIGAKIDYFDYSNIKIIFKDNVSNDIKDWLNVTENSIYFPYLVYMPDVYSKVACTTMDYNSFCKEIKV